MTKSTSTWWLCDCHERRSDEEEDEATNGDTVTVAKAMLSREKSLATVTVVEKSKRVRDLMKECVTIQREVQTSAH